MSFVRMTFIFLGATGLLYGALKTIALFFVWPTLGLPECAILLALSWLAHTAYELAVIPPEER